MKKSVKQIMLSLDCKDAYYTRMRLCNDMFTKKSHVNRIKKRIRLHLLHGDDSDLRTFSVY